VYCFPLHKHTPHTPIPINPDTDDTTSQLNESSSSRSPTDISTHEDGKRRGKERGEDTMSEQIISQLYFHVAKIYQLIIYNLEHKNIPFLFNTFDELFVNNDTMIIIAKREELDNFKIKIDKKLPEQIMKFEEMVQVLKDLGGVVADSDLIYILIKALPASYREKISNALTAGPNIKTSHK
jgi:hypothetical protein